MATKISAADEFAVDWLRKAIAAQQAELEIWRERYPHSARYVSEEARAKVDGREPKRINPIGII